jgi:ABC-2 type transport system ATP-binding protein
LNDPDYVFLDEPTNGLDPEGVIQFRKIIKELAGKGKTIFFSSHILGEVQHVCHTIGIISKGRIVAQGTPEEVKHKMRKDDRVTIRIKVIGAMPRLSDPRIIDATYDDGSALIHASEDIRDAISEDLFRSGLRIRELAVEEKSLEEIFLDTIYQGGMS